MRTIWLQAACAVLLGMSAACGGDVAAEMDDDTGAGGGGGGGQTRVSHLQQSGGMTLTRVDARDEGRWVHLDLESGAEVEASGTWDLAFQRFAVISNGGASGSGGAAVARLDETTFDQVERAPATGWTEDAPDGADDDDFADSAFLGDDPWYAYDQESHTLTPQQRIFVVRTAEGNHFKLELTDYYDDAGTSGFPTFRWAAVEAAKAPQPVAHRLEIDASDAEAFAAIDLRAGEVVEVATLEESEAWDLALRRTAVRTNGGTSGPGQAAVAEAEQESLDTIVEPPPASSFVADELVESGRPDTEPESANPVLATWFDYDMNTHVVSPRDARFVLRTADGSLAKLEILSWDDGHFTIDIVVAAPGAENF